MFQAVCVIVMSLHGASSPSVRRMFLLGERNSGTNYIEQVLLESYSPRYSSTARPLPALESRNWWNSRPPRYPFSTKIPIFNFKHMYRHNVLSKNELLELQENKDILWILVVRRPCDWADGMYRKPWHMCPPSNASRCPGPYIGMNNNATAGISRLMFFESPWRDWSETNLSQNAIFEYKDVFDLRANKLRIMHQLIEWFPDRIFVARFHEVEANPEQFLEDVRARFSLVRNLAPQRMRPGRQHAAICLTIGEWRQARARIDWNLERRFGFSPLDCRTCVFDER